jgi:hypothetical protein
MKKALIMDVAEITSRVSGKRVSSLEMLDDGRLTILFADGWTLGIEPLDGKLALKLAPEADSRKCPAALWPTPRQREYLEFIAKYMERFGVSPAESDIQRHFLVSAPAVNQMVQTLQRLGFITRQPGVPRSIRLVDAAGCWLCGKIHHLKGPRPRSAWRSPGRTR